MMHSQQYTMNPLLPGYCYCFYEYRRNGLRAIMHEVFFIYNNKKFIEF